VFSDFFRGIHDFFWMADDFLDPGICKRCRKQFYICHSQDHKLLFFMSELRHFDADKTRVSDHTVKILDEEILISNLFASDPKQGCEVLFQKYYKLLCSHAVRFVHAKEVVACLDCEVIYKF